MRVYGSLDEARAAFEKYARIEPRLRPLWDLCREAAPVRALDDADDDERETDADEGWCAEDFFHDYVKSDLLLLAGLHRPGAPHELHSHAAFEEVYDLLLNYALRRTCACCAEHGDSAEQQPGLA